MNKLHVSNRIIWKSNTFFYIVKHHSTCRAVCVARWQKQLWMHTPHVHTWCSPSCSPLRNRAQKSSHGWPVSSKIHGAITYLVWTSLGNCRSKLHLVDLAGSERVAKTGAGGRVLEEAKAINLTLHHLEHVIVKLQRQSLGEEFSGEKSARMDTPCTSLDRTSYASSRKGTPGSGSRCRTASRVSSTFVPYRNSVLTMLLRDSLGGNCFTAMIATLSIEEQNIYETISTCHFAQRVACISNRAR